MKSSLDSDAVAIRTQGLSKAFGPVTAVENLDLSVRWGELYGFLGPNGAGKTTTIRMLTGLLRPTKGEITIAGHDLATRPMGAKRLIGYIPDRGYLYEKLTGREFLSFVAGLYEMSPDDGAQRIQEMLKLFDLDGLADDLIAGYSHGMRQKLVFASALLHRPRVLIVDEPMVALDPRSARLVKNLLKQLAAQGAAVFVSTHGLAIAEELCTRIGIIQSGRLIAEGTLEELREAATKAGRTARGERQDLESVFLELTGDTEVGLP